MVEKFNGSAPEGLLSEERFSDRVKVERRLFGEWEAWEWRVMAGEWSLGCGFGCLLGFVGVGKDTWSVKKM